MNSRLFILFILFVSASAQCMRYGRCDSLLFADDSCWRCGHVPWNEPGEIAQVYDNGAQVLFDRPIRLNSSLVTGSNYFIFNRPGYNVYFTEWNCTATRAIGSIANSFGVLGSSLSVGRAVLYNGTGDNLRFTIREYAEFQGFALGGCLLYNYGTLIYGPNSYNNIVVRSTVYNYGNLVTVNGTFMGFGQSTLQNYGQIHIEGVTWWEKVSINNSNGTIYVNQELTMMDPPANLLGGRIYLNATLYLPYGWFYWFPDVFQSLNGNIQYVLCSNLHASYFQRDTVLKGIYLEAAAASIYHGNSSVTVDQLYLHDNRMNGTLTFISNNMTLASMTVLANASSVMQSSNGKIQADINVNGLLNLTGNFLSAANFLGGGALTADTLIVLPGTNNWSVRNGVNVNNLILSDRGTMSDNVGTFYNGSTSSLPLLQITTQTNVKKLSVRVSKLPDEPWNQPVQLLNGANIFVENSQVIDSTLCFGSHVSKTDSGYELRYEAPSFTNISPVQYFHGQGSTIDLQWASLTLCGGFVPKYDLYFNSSLVGTAVFDGNSVSFPSSVIDACGGNVTIRTQFSSSRYPSLVLSQDILVSVLGSAMMSDIHLDLGFSVIQDGTSLTMTYKEDNVQWPCNTQPTGVFLEMSAAGTNNTKTRFPWNSPAKAQLPRCQLTTLKAGVTLQLQSNSYDTVTQELGQVLYIREPVHTYPIVKTYNNTASFYWSSPFQCDCTSMLSDQYLNVTLNGDAKFLRKISDDVTIDAALHADDVITLTYNLVCVYSNETLSSQLSTRNVSLSSPPPTTVRHSPLSTLFHTVQDVRVGFNSDINSSQLVELVSSVLGTEDEAVRVKSWQVLSAKRSAHVMSSISFMDGRMSKDAAAAKFRSLARQQMNGGEDKFAEVAGSMDVPTIIITFIDDDLTSASTSATSSSSISDTSEVQPTFGQIDEGGKLKKGQVAGIVIGTLAGVGVLGAAAVVIVLRKRQQKAKAASDYDM
ncbi:hypothetical protein PROFUN_04727 [Planoprotostelium fungivorum]|uniref:Transmembrane protein n=1 Tax=Planoprotostelium fungivorum TaxID=1890364 RepID=A0A2P6NFY9_9EUKA|nr:hypothetical protein PROFUN_04727 [Planoprotostelium fungivorum]